MKTEKELRAEIEALQNEIQGIANVAEQEERDLTPQEKTRIDAITGSKAGEGLIANLRDDLEREVRRKATLNARAAEVSNDIDWSDPNGPKLKRSGTTVKNDRGQKAIILNKGESYSATVKDGRIPTFALGEAIKAAVCGIKSSTPDYIRNAMTEGNDNRGGYLVPSELASEVIDLARARSVVMQAGAQTVIMKSNELTMVTVVEDPEFVVHPELEEIPLSDIQFSAIRLGAYTIATRCRLARELVEDGPNAQSVIESVMVRSLAAQLDYYALVGGTNNQPMGLLQNPLIAETAGIGAIDWTDLAAATTVLRSANHEPNAFAMAPSIHDALFNTETGDSVNSARGWLEAPPTIRNKQFLHTTACPTTSIVLGDFTNLMWGLRQGVLIEATTTGGDTFKTHAVEIKVTWRGDFNVERAAAFHRLAGVTAS